MEDKFIKNSNDPGDERDNASHPENLQSDEIKMEPQYYSCAPESYHEQPNRKKKNIGQPGCGIYVFIAILVFLLATVLISIVVGTLKSIDIPMPSIPLPSASLNPNAPPNNTPNSTFHPYPSRSPGLMPPLDGVHPTITDPSNPFPDIIDTVKLGVVGIYNYAESSVPGNKAMIQGSGTGFLISSDGYLITNAHVIDGAKFVSAVLVNGKEIEAEVIGSDLTTDIAVLKIDNSSLNLAPLVLGDSKTVRMGEFVIVIGDPSGRELAGSATFGIISATERSVNIDGRTNIYIQTDAAVNPGNSGGPLLNNKGEVIGIVSAKTITASYDETGNAINAEGLGFAIPMHDALSIVEQLITNGYILRPGIGVTVTLLDKVAQSEKNMPDGVYVVSVVENGPGYNSGLRTGDMIVECDGNAVSTTDAFASYVRGKKIGAKLTIRYWREGQYYNAVIVVGDLNNLG
ncbi:MAG: trypsin-like peptidase domain-containing protein [Clostridia bacterium]